MSAFQSDAFQAGAFQGTAPVTVSQGLLFQPRRLEPVEYRAPTITSRVITEREIAAARRRFETEDEWLLGLISDMQYLEAA